MKSSITVDVPDFSPVEQLRQVKNSIIKKDLPNIIKTEQQKNDFPDEYELLVTNKGSTRKRQLSTLSADYLKIGTTGKPLLFDVVTEGGWESVFDAVAYAGSRFIRRAPYVSGQYERSAVVEAAGFRIRPGSLNSIKDRLTPDAEIYFGPTAKYAAVIEAGHFTGYYQNASRGGIVYAVAEDVRAKFGNTVGINFEYQTLGGTVVPIIVFGQPGKVVWRPTRPGTNIRRRKRRGKR